MTHQKLFNFWVGMAPDWTLPLPWSFREMGILWNSYEFFHIVCVNWRIAVGNRQPRHVARLRLACWCKEVHCVRSVQSQPLMKELPVTGSRTQAAIELHASVSPDRWCVTRANLEYLQQQASFAKLGSLAFLLPLWRDHHCFSWLVDMWTCFSRMWTPKSTLHQTSLFQPRICQKGISLEGRIAP